VNVLDMRGPVFLLLYAALSGIACGALWWSIQRRESQVLASPLRARDPYEIAYLRGGTKELVQVVVLALIRRGLLVAVGDSLQARAAAATATASIERAVLLKCNNAIPAKALADFGNVKAAAGIYHQRLVEKHLVPDREMMTARVASAAGIGALLVGFGALKIAHALSTGHSNVGLLICLVLLAAMVLFKIAYDSRTADGHRALKHLVALFGRLKDGARRANSEQLDEVLLLAAVYGVYARSAAELMAWRRLFPVPGRDQKSDGGGCGCGSGCGSGCGGGGGCGGCGS
jgi:uncharacterized protein (TIGR04222 family)